MLLLLLVAWLPLLAQGRVGEPTYPVQKKESKYTEVDVVGLMLKLDDVLQVEELLRRMGYEFKFRTADESYFSNIHPSRGILSSFWITSSLDAERRLKKVRLVSGFGADKLLDSFERIGYRLESVSEGERRAYFRKGDSVATMEMEAAIPAMVIEFRF